MSLAHAEREGASERCPMWRLCGAADVDEGARRSAGGALIELTDIFWSSAVDQAALSVSFLVPRPPRRCLPQKPRLHHSKKADRQSTLLRFETRDSEQGPRARWLSHLSSPGPCCRPPRVQPLGTGARARARCAECAAGPSSTKCRWCRVPKCAPRLQSRRAALRSRRATNWTPFFVVRP